MQKQHCPHIAIVDPNTLSVLGLKAMLERIAPIANIYAFGSMSELMANQPEHFVHYFVAINIVLNNRQFFVEHQRKTIVLTLSLESQMSGFHTICTNQPEKQLVRELLALVQHGHHHPSSINKTSGGAMQHQHCQQPDDACPTPLYDKEPSLTSRELQVLSLIVQGYINKEIAQQLNISLTTVITHRRNIMEKLGAKSVSALTIYAVMHGYVDINNI